MVIGYTWFQHKELHKKTWRLPGMKYFSQMYHLLIDLRHVSHLMDVRSRKYANVDSDHYRIVCRIRDGIADAKKFFDN
jgi:hypothetical protein